MSAKESVTHFNDKVFLFESAAAGASYKSDRTDRSDKAERG